MKLPPASRKASSILFASSLGEPRPSRRRRSWCRDRCRRHGGRSAAKELIVHGVHRIFSRMIVILKTGLNYATIHAQGCAGDGRSDWTANKCHQTSNFIWGLKSLDEGARSMTREKLLLKSLKRFGRHQVASQTLPRRRNESVPAGWHSRSHPSQHRTEPSREKLPVELSSSCRNESFPWEC